MYLQGEQQHGTGVMPSHVNDDDHVNITFPDDVDDDEAPGKFRNTRVV